MMMDTESKPLRLKKQVMTSWQSSLPAFGRRKKIMVSGISLVLMASLFVGCTTPFRAPKPTVAVAHTHHNAPYNKAYTVNGQTYYPLRSAVGYRETGMASWYGPESGSLTATGAHFNPQELTAAHKTLPLPTKVRVTNLHNGQSVDVVVNDRGPFKKNRLIDLSRGAAKKIGLDQQGVSKVTVEYLETVASN